MPTTALVLGGGGSRGAYEIGVWQAMRELNIPFSIVTGASVGAINGAVIAQGSFDEALSLWSELTTEMVFEFQSPPSEQLALLGPYGQYAREFVERGGAGCEALRQLLEEFLDEEKIRSSSTRYGLVTVELDTMRPVYSFIEDIPQGLLIDYILASSACFPALKYHVIEGTKYIDGGYRDNIPVKMALSAGANKIIAVDLKTFGGIDEKAIQKAGKSLIRISSALDLGNFLHFDRENTKRILRLGYLDTLKALGGYEGTYYCFCYGETAHLRRRLLAKCMGLAIDCGIPIGGKTGIIDGIAAAQLQRHLMQASNGGDISSAILVMAEDAGRVFDIPLEPIYSANKYTELIAERFYTYAEPRAEELLHLRIKLYKRISPAAVAKLMGDPSGKLLTAAIALEIRRPDKTQEGLLAAASLFPKEFSAALFLAAII